MTPAIYGNAYQIVQGPGWVGIRYEMIHEARIIPLDDRPHASSKIRTLMGDAKGHWEGDTLVVETTNFDRRMLYRNAEREPDDHRAVHAGRAGYGRLVGDPRRSARPGRGRGRMR